MSAQATDLAAVLAKWGKPDDALVGKLPRVTCADCSKRSCQKHQKAKCVGCGAYVSTAHIHLDYMGHAEVTRALIEIDPLWSWEPVAWSDHGEPLVSVRGNTARMWGRLTVLGKTLPGCGSCDAGKADVEKELIGDFLRNAAMRFGIGLSLWSKSEWEDAHVDPVPLAGPDQLSDIKARVADLDDPTEFKAWWKDNGLPPLNSGALTEPQAVTVLERLTASPSPVVEGELPVGTDLRLRAAEVADKAAASGPLGKGTGA